MTRPRKPTEEERRRMVEFHRMVDDILDRLADRLPPDRLDKLREFSAVGEWSLAVDNLAALLLKNKILVTVSEKEALHDLLYFFPQPDPDNRYIASRDEVLASLTVTGPGQQ